MPRKRPEQDEGVVKRVARKLRETFYGKRTYAKKKFPPSRGSKAARGEEKKVRKTKRTKQIEQRLRESGLTEKEIKRLRG